MTAVALALAAGAVPISSADAQRPPAERGATPAQAIAALNAQREAHGIPGGIVENPEWSDGCAKHASYLERNQTTGHGESSSRPGYTPEGAAAGGSSVLAYSDSWATGNPWETAPIHLHQLLGPRLSVTGVADRDGYVCMYTWPGYQRPAPPEWRTYTYPGPDTTGHRFEETAAENPFTPGSLVGIAEGTTTGPYLYVMFDGPFESARTTTGSGSLTGPDGPVPVTVVGNHTPRLGGYIPVGLEVIPRVPLRPKATYTAMVNATVQPDFDGAPQTLAHTWSFSTAARANHMQVELNRDSRRGSVARISVDTLAPTPDLTLTGPGGALVRPRLRRGSATVALPAPGRWQACASSGGEPTEFDAASGCASRAFPARVGLELPRRVTRQQLILHVPAAAVGRPARIAVGTRSTTVRLTRRTAISLPRARRGAVWEVSLALNAFTRRGVRYEHQYLFRRYRAR